MKIVKYAGFGMAILLSLGMINQATSYTSAQVTSNASVRIVSESEDALVGVKIHKSESYDKDDQLKYSIEFKIINNMNHAIELKSIELKDLGVPYSFINKEREKASVKGLVLGPGKSKDVLVECTVDNVSDIKNSLKKKPHGIFVFKWEDGSATIEQPLSLSSSQVKDLLKIEKEMEKNKVDEKKALEEESIVEDMVPITNSKDEQENKEQKTDKVEKEAQKDKDKQEDNTNVGATEEKSTEKEKAEQ